MKPVDPQFVNSLMENIYGNDEDMVKHPSAKDAEDAVEKHASTMNDFGIPKNIGNAWKAPKSPEPKSQKLEDHAEEEKSLTESVDPMDERVSNIEQGLVSILESLKSLVSNLNEEGPSNAQLDAIEDEDEETENAQDTAVGAEGEAADDNDDVPVGNRGEGRTAKLGHLRKGIVKGSKQEKELRMKARGHKQTKKQLAKNKGKMPKQLNKKEIKEISKDS